ncbi:MAG TPA: hypothetical protein VG458_10665, partial [Solirubrobacterales bacterium]|nr:hypothetical protein [Solirubrobacterales bacterium]
MADRYSQVVNAPVVSTVAKQLGLPRPAELDRYRPGAPVVGTIARQLGLPQPVSLDRYKEGAPVVAGPVL